MNAVAPLDLLPALDSRPVAELIVTREPFTPSHSCQDAVTYFADHPDNDVLPVVDDERPIGMLVRQTLLSRFVRPFQQELYGNKSCMTFMHAIPLVVEDSCSIAELGLQVSAKSTRTMREGFIIVRNGRYVGMSTGQALLSALAELQSTRSRQLLESLHYASRIQRALLTSSDRALSDCLPSHRVRWEPRDMVGGDYYFCRRVEGGILIVVLDCTGHGVPGALMTMIVNASLESALLEGAFRPADVLSQANRRIRHALGQVSQISGVTPHVADGMDCGVLYIDLQEEKIQFSGASIPLFVRLTPASSWMCLPAARGGVGYPEIGEETVWPTCQHPLSPGMRLAITTDGLLDQVGGPRSMAYGRKRFQSALDASSGISLEEQFDLVLAGAEAWQGRQARRDDVTLLMAEVPDDVRCV